MKKGLIVLFLLIDSLVSAKTYYVSLSGKNSNSGAFSSPWLTWSYGLSKLTAGDTLYIRGGVYRATSTLYCGNADGTPDNPICIFNYPGETPVLDCYTLVNSPGFYISGKHNFHIKGITVCRVSEHGTYTDNARGIIVQNSGNIILENVVSRDNNGAGFTFANSPNDTLYLRNCDAYNNCDSIGTNGVDGGKGDGFQSHCYSCAANQFSYVYLDGCRAWHNSDDGYDFLNQVKAVIDSCWSFNNGALEGSGGGIKYGLMESGTTTVDQYKLSNCITAYNGIGFNDNTNSTYNDIYIVSYNNFAFNNETGFFGAIKQNGTARVKTYRNNLSYKNTTNCNSGILSDNTSHNSWDSGTGVTVTDADFVSLDTTGLAGGRKPDGSLPGINFGKLAAGSDLIDKGVDVGITYNGSAPDLGAFEYSSGSGSKLVTGITVKGASGATTITTNKGTLQLTSTILPADASNKTVTWSITSGSAYATINTTSGLLTAIDNGSVTVRATATDGSGVYGSLVVTISNQAIPVTNITVSSAGGATTITSNKGTLQLNASILPSNATNKSVTWSVTSGSGQALISSTGLLTAVSNGTVTAKATAADGSGVSGSLVVTISNQAIPVTGITVTGAGGVTSISTSGGTLQLNASILPSTATNKSITWSVTNGTGQATISTIGLMTAISNGTVTARATAADGSGVYGTLVITISNQKIPVTSITVTAAGGATTITTDGGTLQLSATVLPSNATTKTVNWSITTGSAYATINTSSGLLTANDNGTITARATATDGSGIYGNIVITISNQTISVTGITVTGTGGATTITSDGGTLQLIASVLPANATSKMVSWSLVNGTGQASISTAGLITAVSNGTVTARATATDGSGVYGTLIITITNQIIPVNTVTVSGAGGVSTISSDGGTLQLSAAILPSTATNKVVTWSITSGSDYASINASTGLLTAIDNGTVTVRATSTDGSGVYGAMAIIISNQVIQVTSITVSGAGGASSIFVNNGTLQLNASVAPSNATNRSITWTLTNGTGQATISSTGLVTAVASGTVTAKATALDGSGVSGTLVITITNQIVPVTGITVTGAGGAGTITTDGGTLQLNASILPSNASNKSVIWSISSGSDYATINASTGLLTSVDNGSVTVRATASDGSGVYGTIIINISNQVIPVSGITITGAGGATTINSDNRTLQLSATILPSNATNKSVNWSVANGTGQATISSSGLVTAVANGTVTARALAADGSGITGTMLITISGQLIAVTGITISGAAGATTITSNQGTLQLNASVTPSNASNKLVIWSLTNGTGEATISSTGLVTAVSNGTVTARATAADGSGVFGTLLLTISNQNIPVTSISVSGAGGSASITSNGGTLQLNAEVLPSNATIKVVTWSITSGTGIAVINPSTGLLTAVDNGTVTVRATATDGSEIYGSMVVTLSGQISPEIPVYVNSTIENDDPSKIILNFNLTLGNSIPDISAFIVKVNTVTVNLNSVQISGKQVILGLQTPVNNGDKITLTYIVPVANPLKSSSGGEAGGLNAVEVTNNVSVENLPPVIVVNYGAENYSGFVNEIDASASYDPDKDNLSFTWVAPENVPVSSRSGSRIEFLSPIVSSTETVDFTLKISDGKTTEAQVIPVTIVPFQPDLEVAEVSDVEASSFQGSNYPFNIIDGNIGTMWASNGDNEWLIIELKHPFVVEHVKLAFQSNQEKESIFDIMGSEDKIEWESILTKTASCWFSGDPQVFEFPQSKAGKEFKYIKLVGHGNSVDSWNCISEVKVLGYRYKKNISYEDLPIKIFPNPASDFFNIKIDDPLITLSFIRIVNQYGATVLNLRFDQGLKEMKVPVNLKGGVYTIQFGSNNVTLFSQKLVVIH